MSASTSRSLNPTVTANVGVCCPQLHQQRHSKPATETLRLLSLAPLQPHWHHTNLHTLSRLQRIEHVDVVRSSSSASCAKSQEYVVNIYYEKPQSHIPTMMRNPRPRSARYEDPIGLREMDLQVIHTLSQCCSLRNSVHACIDTDYRASRCSLCQRLGRFMTSGGGRAMVFGSMMLDATEDASALLTGFLNYLVDECRSATSDHDTECATQHHLAIVLEEFLFRS